MEFAMEVQQYIDNEKEMLMILGALKERLEVREKMEGLEPRLAEIRTFELRMREPAVTVKEKERVAKEEKERKKKAQEKMEELAAARKSRGQPPAKKQATNLDPTSSGQNL